MTAPRLLSVVLWFDKGDNPDNSSVVFCPYKQCSFEHFVCLDDCTYVGCEMAVHDRADLTGTFGNAGILQLCQLMDHYCFFVNETMASVNVCDYTTCH